MLSVPPLLILICPMSNFTRMYFILLGPLQIVFEKTFHLLSNLLKLFNILREFHRVFSLWSRARSLSLYSVRLFTCALVKSTGLSVFQTYPCLPISLSAYLCFHLSAFQNVHLFFLLSACLSSAFVFICLVYLCLSLSVCLSSFVEGSKQISRKLRFRDCL